jgi:hypothetical protein
LVFALISVAFYTFFKGGNTINLVLTLVRSFKSSRSGFYITVP